MVERSKDWFMQAEHDLSHAKHDMKEGFYDWACFASQQAAEKAIKAVFYRLNAEVWGHSIYDLLRELDNHYKVPDELLEYALELDKAYMLSCYPNAHPSGSPKDRYTIKDANRLIRCAGDHQVL